MNLPLSRDFLDCLGWTLLHFLWQGLIIAAFFAVGLRLLRRRSANLRYLAGCFALSLMALAPVATFQSLHHHDDHDSTTLQFIQTISTDTRSETILSHPVEPQARPAVAFKPPVHKFNFPEFIETALPWLVAAWSLGVLLLSCRLFAGWLFIQKLRRSASAALVESWQPKLQELACRLGVSRPLRLLQSACVEVPAVIGWLRPVILLPASCLTGLTPAQLESILAHELAHIRRHDYLVNLLQNFVETLLFYHPAVWWVSRRIRQEREHCCDDLAVKICGDAAVYARALATLEELRPAPAQLQLAASGAPLLERIRRLAGQPERSAARPAWPVAGIIALLLLGLLAVSFRNGPAAIAQPAAEPPPATHHRDNISAPANLVVAPSNQSTLDHQQITLSPPTNTAAQTNLSDFSFPPPLIPTNMITPAEKLLFENRSKKTPPSVPSGSPKPQIEYEVKFAEVDAAYVGTNGFAWMFKNGESPVFNLLPAKVQFVDYLGVRPTNAEPGHSSAEDIVYLHTNSYTAPLATLLTDSQNRTAIKNLELQDGVDLLTAPKATSEIDRHVQIQAVDMTSIVTGGSLPGETNGQHFASTPVPFGPVLDIIPHATACEDVLNLTVMGTVTVFVGYMDPATVTNREGKTMPKGWAIPRIQDRQFSANISITNGQTLVLGGAPEPFAVKKEVKSKIPILGDIPWIGHLFRSTKTNTTTTQKSLLIFVTPKLINPDGTPYQVSKSPHNAHLSKGQEAIWSKLDQIHFNKIAYDHLPLKDVINDLAVRAKSLDPAKKGINFFISRGALYSAGVPGAIAPALNLPAAPFPLDSPTNAADAVININPALHDVSLADALDAIAKTSDIPLKYSILDYAVVFSYRGQEPVPLEIRAFHVNPWAFNHTIKEDLDFPGRISSTNQAGLNFVKNQSNSLDHFQVSVRNFFDAIGADFNTNNPANAGKAFVWSDRRGILTVRSTANDLDLIAAVIEALDLAPPTIRLQVKCALVDVRTNNAAPGFTWQTLKTNSVPTTTPFLDSQVPPSARRNLPFISNMSGILDPQQYQAALNAFDQKKDVRFIEVPPIDGVNGIQAHIDLPADAVLTTASRPGKTPGPFDPALMVIPIVSQDENSVELSVNASLSEIFNPTNSNHLKTAASRATTDMEGKPLPVLFSSPTEAKSPFVYTKATVKDGNTLFLSANFTIDSNNVAVSPANQPAGANRILYIFITPTIVNPDGTPYHK